MHKLKYQSSWFEVWEKDGYEYIKEPLSVAVLAHGPRGICVRFERIPIRGPSCVALTGQVKPNEDTYAAARRELQEESGISVIQDELIFCRSLYSGGKGSLAETFVFLVDAKSRDITVGEHEHGYAQWAQPEEALRLTQDPVLISMIALIP